MAGDSGARSTPRRSCGWRRPAPVDDGDGVLARESKPDKVRKDAHGKNKEKESNERAREVLYSPELEKFAVGNGRTAAAFAGSLGAMKLGFERGKRRRDLGFIWTHLRQQIPQETERIQLRFESIFGARFGQRLEMIC